MIKGHIADLMRQAQEMQKNMQKAQECLADIQVEGLSGGGLVKVIMTCDYSVKGFQIDESLLSNDRELLEDLVIAAFNDALRKVTKNSKEKMSSLTAGLPIPPGIKLPF